MTENIKKQQKLTVFMVNEETENILEQRRTKLGLSISSYLRFLIHDDLNRSEK
jgi:hypothetical protein